MFEWFRRFRNRIRLNRWCQNAVNTPAAIIEKAIAEGQKENVLRGKGKYGEMTVLGLALHKLYYFVPDFENSLSPTCQRKTPMQVSLLPCCHVPWNVDPQEGCMRLFPNALVLYNQQGLTQNNAACLVMNDVMFNLLRPAMEFHVGKSPISMRMTKMETPMMARVILSHAVIGHETAHVLFEQARLIHKCKGVPTPYDPEIETAVDLTAAKNGEATPMFYDLLMTFVGLFVLTAESDKTKDEELVPVLSEIEDRLISLLRHCFAFSEHGAHLYLDEVVLWMINDSPASEGVIYSELLDILEPVIDMTREGRYDPSPEEAKLLSDAWLALYMRLLAPMHTDVVPSLFHDHLQALDNEFGYLNDGGSGAHGSEETYKVLRDAYPALYAE